jgi:predicted RNA binding protein YcfA (HicA-like mRNA interferase family)
MEPYESYLERERYELKVSQIEKLITKLKSRPKTFAYSDLKRILLSLGYVEDAGGRTTGSHIQFIHNDYAPISLAKPHPGNELKSYLVRLVADKLEEEGLI